MYFTRESGRVHGSARLLLLSVQLAQRDQYCVNVFILRFLQGMNILGTYVKMGMSCMYFQWTCAVLVEFFKTSLSVFVLIEYLRVTMFRYALSVHLIYNPSRVASTVSLFMG